MYIDFANKIILIESLLIVNTKKKDLEIAALTK